MDAIPYTIETRQDTGLYNAKLGIWLFLASEVMLFGGLFSSYILLRTGALQWPAGSTYLNVPIGAFNTLMLLISNLTVVLAWTALRENNFAKHKKMLGFTILFAAIFLGIKAYEYTMKFEHHHFPSENTFLAVYFTMTGVHALHILGGIIVLGYHFLFGGKMWKAKPQQFTNRLEIVGLYWHFVDLVWVFLFPVLYLF